MMLHELGGIETLRYVAIGLFVGVLLMIEIGRRLAPDAQVTEAGFGLADGSMFGLLGLLLAFTFSGAASRLDARRSLVVEEANDISTAYARIDLLPAPSQAALRALFRRYTDTRLEIYRKLPDIDAAKEALERANALQPMIWAAATEACRTAEGQHVAMLVLPSLNAMFDITMTRTMAALHHPPMVVYAMLLVLVLTCALIAGYQMSRRGLHRWVHALAFGTVMALTVYMILDLEYPRAGFLRMDAADRAIEQVRRSMDEPRHQAED